MTTDTRLVTADELLRIPDDGMRRELIHGEIKVMPPARQQHGRIALQIAASLLQHVQDHQLGRVYAAETGFKLASDPDHVRAPDAAFVSRARVAAVGDVEGFFPGAPDLAVQVVSPGDTFAEVEDKVFDWLEAGTRAVIVVNPKKRSVTLYRSFDEVRVLGERDTLSIPDVVPGWAVAVSALFAE